MQGVDGKTGAGASRLEIARLESRVVGDGGPGHCQAVGEADLCGDLLVRRDGGRQEKDLVDGLCPHHKIKPRWLQEDNYFFALSRFQDRLRDHIQAHHEFVRPEVRRNEILNVIDGGLEDISVSRAGAQWGIPLPIDDSQGIRGWIVHIDHFGNCVTNIPHTLFENRRAGRTLKCYVGNAILNEVHTTYGLVESGEPLLLFGSTNFLEIAVNTGNASDLLDIRRGTPVNVVFLEDR